MASRDRRIDAYINRSESFAIPVLEFLREVVHEACPDVVETMKWSFPHFEYNNSILCSMASFRHHCAFGFWLGSQMKDSEAVLEKTNRSSMGHLGRISSVSDLPSKKVMVKYIKEAMELSEKGIKPVRKSRRQETRELIIPAYFLSALKKSKKALNTFDNFNYSQKKDYVEWLAEAKTQPTREKRLNTALEWLEEGKVRHWQYQNSKGS